LRSTGRSLLSKILEMGVRIAPPAPFPLLLVSPTVGIAEPRSGDKWIVALRSISADLGKFEGRHRIRLETLVEDRWKPIAVGRAYDMVAGPTGRESD
jgi:hypothetical protein